MDFGFKAAPHQYSDRTWQRALGLLTITDVGLFGHAAYPQLPAGEEYPVPVRLIQVTESIRSKSPCHRIGKRFLSNICQSQFAHIYAILVVVSSARFIYFRCAKMCRGPNLDKSYTGSLAGFVTITIAASEAL